MYTPPAAEILTIGDELCRGEIVDTNSTWLAERLTLLGFHVRWRSSTTDDTGDMEDAFLRAAGRAEVVICSGGLGPTEDDRTVDVLGKLLGTAPLTDEAHLSKMRSRFAERGFELTPNNMRQVRIPGGGETLTNRAGLAPGFRVRLSHQGHAAEIYATPGVPREMKSIFDDEIEPRLLRALRPSSASSPAGDAGNAGNIGLSAGDAPATAKRVWRVAGLGESHVDHRLRGLLDGVADATLHFRIAYPENLVTVVARRGSQEEADQVIARLDVEVRARLGEHIYGTDGDTLPMVVGRLLREQRRTLCTAESCTGGLVADQLTDVAGSSDYFLGGVVCYADELKQRLLGVRPETLAAHGAVSEPCVREMAAGAREATGASYAIAISGIAGPGGGSDDKPVGTVFFAVEGPSGCEARKLLWPTDRRMVKQLAASASLLLLYKQLKTSNNP